MGQEVLNGEEMVAYEIGLDLLKYDYTLELDPNQGQDSPTRSNPTPSPSAKHNKRKKGDRPGSSQNRGDRNKTKEITQRKLEEMSHSFNHAIRWMELAKAQYDQLGDVVVDVCKALGNVAIQDIDAALSQVARKQEVAERDSQINQLIREKEDLQVQLQKMEWELKLEQSKTQGAHRLIGLLEEHVRNPGDLVIKARIYNEAVAKIGGVTALKLIHMCVDYSTRMETILVEMRVLFDNWNRFFRDSPVPLEKVPDLTDFQDLPPTELLQNLQTPTTLRTNLDSAESEERPAPGSDARTSEVGRSQQVAPTSVPGPMLASVPGPTSTPVPEPGPTPEAQDLISMDTSKTPPLPIDPALVVPSPPTTSPTPANPRPKTSALVPPLSETARKYMESVRRQAAFTHTPGF